MKNFAPAPDLGRLRSLLPGSGRPTTTTGKRRGESGLALTELRGNLTITGNEITAWYTLEDHVWPFQPDAAREAVIDANASQYAQLAGHHLHLRRTSVPFPVGQWARNLSAHSRPLPDAGLTTAPEGIMTFDRAQRLDTSWTGHLANATRYLAAGDHSFSRTQLGVTFNARGMLAGKNGEATPALLRQVDELAETLGAYGLRARPSTPTEMTWLIYRSVGIGLTPPDHFPGNVGPDDIDEFTENVDWCRGRYASTTQLTDRRTGRSVHVAVLTVGRMEALDIPQNHQPWAHLSDHAGYPVEWSSRIDVLSPAAVRPSIERRLLTIRSQRRDYEDHDLPELPELERLADRATVVGDQMDTGLPVDATRVHGWHRMAVYGGTEDDCLTRVRDLARFYSSEAHITLAHPRAQVAMLREFIPGEPVANTGYLRRMPARVFAAAMPQATARVGDHRGDLIGLTAGAGEHPVLFDMHFPMEVRERSGLAVMVSEPGGGKSTLMGGLAYLAARRGVRVTLMDPSGPLARLCDMPELRPFSRVVNLTGSQPGTLAPYAMVPTPQRRDFRPGPAGDADHENAVANARAERAWLVLDIAQMLLPPQVVNKDETIIALREALRRVPQEETSTLEDVCAALRNLGTGHAEQTAALLLDMQQLPHGRLFFGAPPPGVLDAAAPLTVITMSGLTLPDLKIERQYWSVEESLAVPMLHVAHRLAVRRCYSGDMHARKFVGLDEAHFMKGWNSGRAFLTRLARDSRKWNTAALVASQDPEDILTLDMQNLVTTTFVGRIADDSDVAAGALKLLRVAEGSGYERVLAGLSQYSTSSTDRLGYREVVMRDVDGRVQKVRVDVSYVPGLLDYLNTTPGSRR